MSNESTIHPKILISGSHKPHSIDPYTAAAERVGAVVTAGYLPKGDLEDFDGLILAGGCDVTPSLYGEEMNGAVNTDIARDECELALTEAFRKAGKPIFGICRGIQLINVAYGGTLIQDLPLDPDHRTDDPENPTIHRATALDGSLTAEVYGTSFAINSYHHQALEKVADGFRVTSRSDDELRLVEAIEHESEPVFAVQFHPERMGAPAADGDLIMARFIDMCRANMKENLSKRINK